MSLDIITAEQRLSEATVKGIIGGDAGVGKTTLIKTLDPATTLFISLEEGELSLQKDDEFGPRFMGETIRPSNWLELKALVEYFAAQPRPEGLAKYRTLFIDSITVASKWCFEWCQTQPRAFSDKTGKPDIRGAYGLLAEEMVAWAWMLKKLAGLNVWLIGGLDFKAPDEYSPKEHRLLLTGAKLALELPFIMDYVLVMRRITAGDPPVVYTILDTDPNGEYGTVGIKVRGGGFDKMEEPHLGKLMTKAIGRRPAPVPPPSNG